MADDYNTTKDGRIDYTSQNWKISTKPSKMWKLYTCIKSTNFTEKTISGLHMNYINLEDSLI